MSTNQCKNCDRDRDLNNNFVGYPNSYLSSSPNNNNNRNTASAMTNNSATATINNTSNVAIKAKIMFGSVQSIKELREHEKAEKARLSQAATQRRQ
jgi:hypothetical protein